MRYVPEELYLTWKNRAEVSRKYAEELIKSHNEITIRLKTLNHKCWDLHTKLDSTRDKGETYKRLLKTRKRLQNSKEYIKQLETKLKQITDVLTDEDRSN